MQIMEQSIVESLGENIDALVTLDLRGHGIPRAIYQAARRMTGKPLSTYAAQRLVDHVHAGDVVLIGTGFIFPPWLKGELDGVIGSALLARALSIGLNAKPVILCEEEIVGAVRRLLTTAGLLVYGEVEEVLEYPHSTSVVGISKDELAAEEQGRAILEKTNADTMVSVERPGRNDLGVYHMGNGISVTEYAARIEPIFQLVQKNGGLTVAIGDLGNELGMAGISDVVRQVVPFGAKCACRCGGGIAAAVASDVCVVGAVSDWAAYGVVAAISFLTGNEEVMHSPDLEKRLLRAGCEAGLIDGSGYAIPAVDGAGEEYNALLVEMLGRLLKQFRKIDLKR